jgi:hypothetical protein
MQELESAKAVDENLQKNTCHGVEVFKTSVHKISYFDAKWKS